MTSDQSSRPAADDWPGAEGPPGADRHELDAHLRAWADRAVVERPASVDSDPWRQSFHIQPPTGLLNDPNGLVQHGGVYHLCYQWHPGAPRHGLKYWAYLTSTDLVHWTDRGVALAPSDSYDLNGCYSGSGVVHDDAVHLLYTGNLMTPEGRHASQALARIDAEGVVHKHPENPVVPVLAGMSQHVRDPKVWAADGQFWMVLGAQTLHGYGTALLLSSPDLVTWTLLGRLGGGPEDPVGGYMWECPDLLRFADADVLVISAQHDLGEDGQPLRFFDQVLYAVGRLELDPVGFARATAFMPIDQGPDFYAPQTFEAADGRRILVGWMGMPDHPGHPSLEHKHPTVANGWVHCLTVPRTVTLEPPVDGATRSARLRQWPVAELEVLRGEPVAVSGLRIAAGTSTTIPGVAGTMLDIEATVRAGAGARLVMRLRDGEAGLPALLLVDPAEGVVTLDRTQLGTGEGGSFTCTLDPSDSVDLRVLLDSSSVEVFVDGGRSVLTARIYPRAGDELVSFDADGGDVDIDLTAWPLRSASE